MIYHSKLIDMIKPKPTEYQGIVFKSKAEAQFAWMLSNGLFHNVNGWIYEPRGMSLENGYVPDFISIVNLDDSSRGLVVIEYKPKQPTKEYLRYFNENMAILRDLDSFRLIVSHGLVYGNVYDGKFFRYSEEVHSEIQIIPSLLEEAKHQRFDLL